MHKLRATSFLRRTISEPYSARRLSAVVNQTIPQQSTDQSYSKLKLLRLNDSLLRESYLETPPVHTFSSDLYGLADMIWNWLNILLIFVPLGLLSHYHQWGDLWTFWFNFIALIPLAAILGQATEEIALHTGDLIGGLLNATFGNAVEMIITVQSLRAGLLTVVQGTLLGSILSNLLLVLGMSFFAGGLFHHVQTFNRQGAACSTSLLMLACLAFILPTVVKDSQPDNLTAVLQLSRFTAVLVGCTYFLYLFFQLYTHLSLFQQETHSESGSSLSNSSDLDCVGLEDWPALSFPACIIILTAITTIISFQSECLVGSIEGVVQSTALTKSFIGVILLPIVGNAAEHATAVTVAMKNKPDLTMGVAVGSSTQIAMFMVPFSVIAGWMMNIPMTLAFDHIAVVVLTFSILITIGIVQDGESNWLEGAMLMVAYAIIAGVYWFNEF